VGGSNAYPDPAPKKWVGPDPEKHIGSTFLARGGTSKGTEREGKGIPTKVKVSRINTGKDLDIYNKRIENIAAVCVKHDFITILY